MEANAENRIEIRAQKGAQTNFLDSLADIAIYGGAAGGGKTVGLLFEPLKWIGIVNFAGVIFRRETPQINKEGGLWDTSERFYPLMGGHGSQHGLRWTFVIHEDNDQRKKIIGYSTISFAHLQLERDKLNWQGTAIPYIGFDELPHFTESQFFYLMSRNRSSTGIPGYIRATCNPDPDSWVARFIAWWIDDKTGYAIPERAGVLRWFLRINDKLVWADSAGELLEIYSFKELPPEHPTQPRPKSVTFIPAKITDNAILMREDPSYLSNLMAQTAVDRARLLDGNWKMRATAGTCFKRGWFEVIPFSRVPMKGRTIRYFDRASTVPSPQNPDPDWTVGLKVRHVDGEFFVMHMERFRERPHGVKTRIKNMASQDGLPVEIFLEGDPGSAGEFEIDAYITFLAGFTVRTNKPTKNKYERAKPAMAQAEGRKIYVVEGDWNEDFFNELENFSDDPKEYNHDDIVDTISGAVKVLTTASTGFTSTAGLRVGQNKQTNFPIERLRPSDLT